MNYLFCAICALCLPVQDDSVELDYTRISQPTVASQLELSDEQRARVAGLLTERIEKLAAAPAAERGEIRQANNAALKALLSPSQLTRYQTILAGGKLRFNFRGEKWPDVLSWFATEAGLSLVMNEIPPGEFTYADQKEYTSAQAIDLLNSVLLSRGYTLIRREKILIVANLASGLPYELVPDETIEGLAKRGKFEWVRIKFPLSGRPVAAVLEEVEPVISEHGKATPLAASGQLMVTETAGKMESIGLLVSAVPVPVPAPKPPVPPTPPPKVFVVHSAKGLDIAGTVETIRNFFDTTAVVGDSQAEEIQVYAPQALQDLIKSSLERMIANASNELKVYTDIYPLEEQALDNVQSQLANLFPETNFSIDSANSRLIVAANAKVHQGVQETLDKLGASTGDVAEKTVVIYSVESDEAENLAAVLTEMLPRAQVIVQGKRIAVRGRATDQEVAKSLVEQMAIAGMEKSAMQLRFYDLNENLSDITTTLQSIAAEGTVTWLESRKKLSVIADAATQDLVRKTLEQINEDLPKRESRSLKIFKVTASQKTKFDQVFSGLSSEFGDASLISGSGPTEIAVVADAEQHAAIGRVLESLAALESSESQELVSIPLTVDNPKQLLELLSKKVSAHEFLLNPEETSLLVWIDPKDIESVRRRVTQIEGLLPKKEILSLEIYPLKGSVTEIVSFLTPIAGEAKITPDSSNRRIVVWAKESEHEKIRLTIGKLDMPVKQEKKLEIYPLKNADVSIAESMIGNLDLEANVTPSQDGKSLLIWATAEEHNRIRSLVERLATLPASGKPQVELYPVDRDAAAKTLAAVQAVFPSANLTLDSSSKNIISIAEPELQIQVRTLVEKLQPEKPATPKVLMSYELQHSDAATVVTMLNELHPEVRFAADERANRVLVTAELAEQPRFRAIISQLDARASERNEKVLRTYPLAAGKNEVVGSVIQPLLPEMTFSFDKPENRMIVLGTQLDHQKLVKLLEQVDDGNATHRILKHYSTGSAPIEEVQNVLLQIVPTAVIAVNGGQAKMVVWATEQEQKLIEAAINQLNNVSGALTLKNYDLDRQLTGDVVTLLQGLSRTARVALSPDGMQLVVYATDADQKLFSSVVEEFKKSDKTDLLLRSYQSSESVIAAAVAAWQTVPEAIIVPQSDPEKLVVWASEEDHAKIRKSINELKAQLSPEKGPKTTIIYPLGKVTRSTVVEMINQEVRNAAILADDQADRMIVRATDQDHRKIDRILKDLKKTFDLVREKVIRSHPVRKDLKTQATSTIGSLMPAVEFLTNGNDSLILARATADEHASLTELIQTLEKEIAREIPRTLASYELEKLEKPLASQILVNRFPEITMVSEDNSRRLLIWANPDEHLQIPEILKQLERTVATESGRTVQVYNVDRERMAAADVLELVDPAILENMTIQTAVATNSLIVRASEARHAQFKSALEAVVQQIQSPPRRTTQVYDFPGGNASSFYGLVSPLMSDSGFSVATDGKKLAVTSNAEGHQLIVSVKQQLEKDADIGGWETVVYKMNAAAPSVLESALRTLSPQARVTADDRSQALIVTASKTEHLVIANILSQVNDSSLGKKTEVFALKTAAGTSVVNAISNMLPNAAVTADTVNRSLVVTAPATDFPRIEAIIEKMELVSSENGSNVVVKVYPFDESLVDAADMQSVIDENLGQGMNVRINEVGNGLIIRTTPEKHQQLIALFEQVIDQLPESRKIETRVYRMGSIPPTAIQNVLGTRFASADVAVDETTRTVVATVSLADHNRIKSLLEEMQSNLTEEKLVSRPFKLNGSTPSIIGSVLESLLPEAIVNFDAAARTVIVTGTERELKLAADLVSQVDGSEKGKLTRLYRLNQANPKFVSPAIEQLVPDARISVDVDSKTLFVTASEEDHNQVAQMVEELNQRKGLRSEVYRLTTADPRYVMPAVQSLLPEATVSADRYSKSLFVTGTDEDHVQVEQLVEKMNGEVKGQRSEVYKLIEADPRYLSPAIQALLPEATVSSDRYSKTLFVTGTDEDHQQVRELIEKLNGRGAGKTTEVYKLAKASSVIIQPALSALIPDGNVTADKVSNTVVVSASADDQAKVAQVIEKLDKATGEEFSLRIYKSKFDNTDALNQAVSNIFRDDPEVRITNDWENRRMMIVATEVKHKLITELIDQVDVAKPRYEHRFAKVYHLENIESAAAEGVIRSLYGWWSPRIDVRREQGTNALIVVATDKQHVDLGKSIQEVDGDLRQLEVFQLVNVDPYTVELAIEQLFAEIQENMRPSATSDFGTQQLFVRGSAAQIGRIREMLQKMGETFDDELSPVSKGGVRTIPFRGNAMEALREIEAFWPRIRKNRIEIIRSGRTKIKRNVTPRKGSNGGDEPEKELPPKADEQGLSLPDCGGKDETGNFSDPNDGKEDVGARQETAVGPKGVPQEPKPVIRIEDLKPVKRNGEQPGPVNKKQDDEKPQIVVIAGENEITIASSDLEALDQLEYLLRTIQRGNRSGLGSSNFAVYLLSNSSARDTAKLLTDLFEAIPEMERQGSVGNAVFVAEERLNAMVVYGTRKERDVIQEIIEVLDAEDLPDSLTTPVPELIQVRNSSADRILRILESVYRNQLTSGGGRKKVEIPEGVTTAVATMLQQINAATTGPILTLGIDAKTNSIVMRAPMELGREIKTFVERLDSTARESSANRIRVLKMEGTNAARVRTILNGMTDGS
ncbi:MAG: secretin N-terminal domain-containing protein [Planctomycetota bacterium]|nr:secretin N-terminal domain-containing protein [Planctomycetota bacterium]